MYQKWKELAEKSNIDQLKEYFKEAEYFFINIDSNKSKPLSSWIENKEEINTSQLSNKLELNLLSDKTKNMSTSKSDNYVNLKDRSKSVLKVSNSDPITTTKENEESINVSNFVSQPESSERNIDIMSKSICELKNTFESDTVELNGICEPIEFIKCIEKLLLSTITVDKHLDNIQKANREFYEFEKQDLKLNAIKQTLESLALALKTSLLHKKSISEKSDKETSKKISKLISNLTKQHQNVVKKYKEKNVIYINNYDKWIEFKKNYQTISEWLDSTLNKVNNLKETNLENVKLVEIIKDFSNLTSYRLLLERTNLNGHDILIKSNEQDASLLDQKLNSVNQKWKDLISLLSELKEKYVIKSIQCDQQVKKPDEQTPFEILNKKMNESIEWLGKTEDLLSKQISPVENLELERLIFELKVNNFYLIIIKNFFLKNI